MTPPATSAQRPAKLDTNGDGVIDRSEAAANPRLAAKFDELDRNKDGKLSRDEMPRWQHGRRGHGGGAGPGWTSTRTRISRDEAKADPRLAARFDQFDLNKDGYLDKADRELRMKQHRDAWFAAADTNKDGQLSKAEFDAARGPMHGGPRQGGPRDGGAPKSQR